MPTHQNIRNYHQVGQFHQESIKQFVTK